MKRVFFSVQFTFIAQVAVIAFFLLNVGFQNVSAQESISGKVLSETNEALPGATIMVQNSLKASLSDAEGNFKISGLMAGNYDVLISFIGYQTEKVSVSLPSAQNITVVLKKLEILSDGVTVTATSISSKTPMAYTNLSGTELQKNNYGQDVPYLLSLQPSVTVTSDAGTGIGYTGLRIRGTSGERINVTLNGIPMNDAESHIVYWVDIPDFASSVNSVQIQRGAGASTNGAAAFGATVNMQTQAFTQKPFAQIDASAGSFNTWKTSANVGSGLINDHLFFGARLSKIHSDGYIDRARADMDSWFLTGGYYGKSTLLKFNIFSGVEETYQAWGGVPGDSLKTNRTFNEYTYENQVDHYKQTHFQMLFTQQLGKKILFNAALHYTKGLGYYEEFYEAGKSKSELWKYNISPITIDNKIVEYTDLVRRKWLDNDFYGSTYSFQYKTEKLNIIAGGSLNRYDGRHYGKVIWARIANMSDNNHEYYRNYGVKDDINSFMKLNYQVSPKLNLYADLQYRIIDYTITGQDQLRLKSGEYRKFDLHQNYNFFNPKCGVFFDISANQNIWMSYSTANREPSRYNFTDAEEGEIPQAETLYDYEMGYNYNSNWFSAGITLYRMQYKNQLVLTGEINDIGAAIMTNVDNSYRQGIEISAAVKGIPYILWFGNLTLSQNKIVDFEEYVETYDVDWNYLPQQKVNYSSTDISFSPNVIASSVLQVNPLRGFNIIFTSKYTGKQFADNTSNESRKLKEYATHDLRFEYNIPIKGLENLLFRFSINNIFDKLYESNAWSYHSYLADDQSKTTFSDYTLLGYYPQAGRNYMLGMSIKF